MSWAAQQLIIGKAQLLLSTIAAAKAVRELGGNRWVQDSSALATKLAFLDGMTLSDSVGYGIKQGVRLMEFNNVC